MQGKLCPVLTKTFRLYDTTLLHPVHPELVEKPLVQYLERIWACAGLSRLAFAVLACPAGVVV